MARKPAKAQDVENYKHDGAKRVMIPTSEQQGFVEEDEARPIKLRYPRNADLDPQLVWRGKDAEDGRDLYVDAPPIYIQEKIHPRVIIERLKRATAARADAERDIPDLFADFNGRPSDLEARTEFYQHEQNWQNRMILGDALMVMASLAERENLRSKVQSIYFDPPYGIEFNSNWQTTTGSRSVTDGSKTDVSREPEVIRAFRDTWKDGIHSYLSYIRERLIAARDLLADSGSIFVQIGDGNVHRVRAVLDEVFGPECFIVTIVAKKKGSQISGSMNAVNDYILWYGKSAKDSGKLKIQPLFQIREDEEIFDDFPFVELEDGYRIRIADLEEQDGLSYRENYAAFRAKYPNAKLFGLNPLKSGGFRKNQSHDFHFQGRVFPIGDTQCWKHTVVIDNPEAETPGMDLLAKANRLFPLNKDVRFVRYTPNPSIKSLSNFWDNLGGAASPVYVVQTNTELVKRCILMTTDPGDLVLDPTCGSGTTAFVSEQWGRRWITIDTSRVALALARTRMMAARYPYYLLSDTKEGAAKEAELASRLPREVSGLRDIRRGFVLRRARWNTSGSIANNVQINDIWNEWQEPLDSLLKEINSILEVHWKEWEVPRHSKKDWNSSAKELLEKWWKLWAARQAEIDEAIERNSEEQLLHDRPFEDRAITRVAGPFTVESLSPYRVIPSEDDPRILDMLRDEDEELPRRMVPKEQTDFAQVVMEHLKKAGVQNTKKDERLEFESIEPWPGKGYVAFEGRYEERGATRRAAIAIGPEYDAVGYEFVRNAAREARDAFDILIVCGFQFAPEVDDSMLNFGRLKVLKARMNQDIRMGDKLKNTGAGNLFVVFGEPDIEVRDTGDGKVQVEIKGVDIFDPTTGEVKSSDDPADDIACWFIDDDYDEESFFVRQAYFLGGAAGDPYKALKRSLKAEIDEEAWASLRRTVSHPFQRPERGLICVKVINHFGDEVQKVFRV